MTPQAAFDAALAAGDVDGAALLAAEIPEPVAYRKAMQRAFEERQRGKGRTTMQPVFELTRRKVKLLDFNPRKEIHGNERESGGDIKVSIAIPAEELAMFDPLLRSTLYCARDGVHNDLATQDALLAEQAAA